MSKRLRLSDDKADLVNSLSDKAAKQLLQAIQDYKYQGDVPEEEEASGLFHYPGSKQAPKGIWTGTPYAKPKPVYAQPYVDGDPNNVLVIGDLHAPFIREGYLEFCLEQQKKYNCGTVIAIGDIVDQHAISYHESDPDGMSAGQEYAAAKECLAKLFAMFPVATCLLGNHDLLIARKARTAGLSAHFVRSLGEVYGAPTTWSFVDELELNDVVYRHGGIGGDALRMATHSRRSTVQGHLHTKFYTQYLVSDRDAIYAVQVGSGVDDKAYAFAYGKGFPQKSAIGCAVILNEGTTPLNLLMPL